MKIDSLECRLGRQFSTLKLQVYALGVFVCLGSLVAPLNSNGQELAKQDWAGFRNGGNSHVSSDAKLPVKWSPEQGIGWQVELPGYGQSSPVIVGNKVFVTAVEGPNKENNLVVCLDRESGKELWRFLQESTKTGPSNYMFSRAAPSPVVDQDHLFAFFESGDLYAIRTEDGQVAWQSDLKDEIGDLKSRHGLGSSLAQSNDRIFLNLEHDGPSALFAFNKKDGSVAWKGDRPSGSSWSSPVVMKQKSGQQVVISSAGEAVGFNAENGQRLWRIDGLAGNTVPSPLVEGNRIYLGARKPEFGSSETAAKSNLCLEFESDSTEPTVAWRSERCITDYASPVISGNYVYLISGIGVLGCLNKETGEEIYRQRLGIECWATPVVQNDHLFVFGKFGKTVVVKVGDSYSKVSENALWDPQDAPSPVSYKEHFPESSRGHGHGGHGHGTSSNKSGSHGQKPGAGMLAGMLKADADGDGFLSGDEISPRLKPVMENIDLNKDGKLDKNELEKMAESFAAKRKNTRQSSSDPIVYGVAADSKGFLVRTGTRLYSVGEASKE